MSKQDKRKMYAILFVLLLVVIASIIGAFASIILILVTDEMGWIALFVLSGILFFGSIIIAIYLSYTKSGKKIGETSNVKSWLIVAIISFILAVCSYFLLTFGMIYFLSVMTFFLALSFFSIFVVIKNRNRFRIVDDNQNL